MDNNKYLWIQTRDGSPTLWSNELGESFRSVKGAWLESWCAFVQPALAFWSLTAIPVQVGEFGLGPGTNWVLWRLAEAATGRPHGEYFAIERDLSSFAMGLERWETELSALKRFVAERLGDDPEGVARLDAVEMKGLPKPRVFAGLVAAIEAGALADVWFHDPFGFDVNPDGYTPATLAQCARLWKPRFWGGSYACNRKFRDALATIDGVEARPALTGDVRLKRERIEFHRLG